MHKVLAKYKNTFKVHVLVLLLLSKLIVESHVARESRSNAYTFKIVTTTIGILHITMELVNTYTETQPYHIYIH